MRANGMIREANVRGSKVWHRNLGGEVAWVALACSLVGCKSAPEKAVLAFVGEEACGGRVAALDSKDDEALLTVMPSCPQKHAAIEHDACKKLTADGSCVAHGRAAKEGPDLVDYCLVKTGETFKVDGACTAAAALVRAYHAAESCDERTKLVFAPDENKDQLAVVKSRKKTCKAEVKGVDLASCAGALHGKDGKCIAKATLGDGKVSEVCVRRDADKLTVDLRCTEMLDGPDGRRVVVKPVKSYDEQHPENEFVSVELVVSDSDVLRKAWVRRDEKRALVAQLRDVAEPKRFTATIAPMPSPKKWDEFVPDQLVVLGVAAEGHWQSQPAVPTNGKCPEGMVFVSASDSVMPAWNRRQSLATPVTAFCIDALEVTAEAYEACVSVKNANRPTRTSKTTEGAGTSKYSSSTTRRIVRGTRPTP